MTEAGRMVVWDGARRNRVLSLLGLWEASAGAVIRWDAAL